MNWSKGIRRRRRKILTLLPSPLKRTKRNNRFLRASGTRLRGRGEDDEDEEEKD